MKKIKLVTVLISFAILYSTKSSAAFITCLRNSSGGWDCTYHYFGSCDHPGKSGPRFCMDAYVATSPIIYTNGKRAVLADNNKVIGIASDKKDAFVKDKNKRNDSKTIEHMLRTDDGIISRKNLEAMAKGLGAKIIEVEELPATNYCPACKSENTNSVTTNGHTLKFGGEKRSVISIGVGFNTLSSSTIIKSNALGEIEFIGNVYVPIIASKRGCDGHKRSKTSFGINASGQYSSGTGSANGNISLNVLVNYAVRPKQ